MDEPATRDTTFDGGVEDGASSAHTDSDADVTRRPSQTDGGRDPLPTAAPSLSANGGETNYSGAGTNDEPRRCNPGSFSCAGDERTVCLEDGTWRRAPAAEQCGGITPVCTSYGVCAAFRLRGGISGIGAIRGETGPYLVKEGGFGVAPRVCSDRYCYVGGLAP